MMARMAPASGPSARLKLANQSTRACGAGTVQPMAKYRHFPAGGSFLTKSASVICAHHPKPCFTVNSTGLNLFSTELFSRSPNARSSPWRTSVFTTFGTLYCTAAISFPLPGGPGSITITNLSSCVVVTLTFQGAGRSTARVPRPGQPMVSARAIPTAPHAQMIRMQAVGSALPMRPTSTHPDRGFKEIMQRRRGAAALDPAGSVPGSPPSRPAGCAPRV